jgi:hypothetical protein
VKVRSRSRSGTQYGQRDFDCLMSFQFSVMIFIIDPQPVKCVHFGYVSNGSSNIIIIATIIIPLRTVLFVYVLIAIGRVAKRIGK